MATFATWNPSDKEASITLNNINTQAYSGGATWRNVRSTTSKTSGKWYWEVVSSFGGIDNCVAIANSSASLGAGGGLFPGYNTNSKAYYSDGRIIYNGVFTAYGAAYTTGDVIGVALDMDTGNVTFYKNGVSQGTVAIQVTGAIFAFAGIDGGARTQTANFGQKQFSYPPPSGYSYGLSDTVVLQGLLEFATWNPDDKWSITLSNLNLTAAGSSGTSYRQTVRANIWKETGKWYWEYTVTQSIVEMYLGLGNQVFAIGFDTWIGVDGNTYGYHSQTGNLYFNSSPTSTWSTFAVGDVIGIALNMDTKYAYFYKNGVLQGNAYVGSSAQPMIPIVTLKNGATIVANFGQTAFTYPVPSGYNYGLTVFPYLGPASSNFFNFFN